MRKPFVILLGVAVAGMVLLAFMLKSRLSGGGDTVQAPSEPVVSTYPPGSERLEPLKGPQKPAEGKVETKDVQETKVETPRVTALGSYELLSLDYEIAKLERQKKIAELKRDIKDIEGKGGRRAGAGAEAAPPAPPPVPPPAPSVPQVGFPVSPVVSSPVEKAREVVVRSVVCSDECRAIVSVDGQEYAVRKGSSVAGLRVADVKEAEVLFDSGGSVFSRRVSLNVEKVQERRAEVRRNEPVRLQPTITMPSPVPVMPYQEGTR